MFSFLEQLDDNNFQSTAIHYLIDQLYSIDNDILFKQIQLSIPNSSNDMYTSFSNELNEKFILKKNNELFGCEPFFISTGMLILYRNQCIMTLMFVYSTVVLTF